MTVRAAHAQEPVFQAATLEVILEFPLDIVRQGRAKGCHLIHKRGIVLRDELVEESLLWTVALVPVNTMAGAGFFAGRSMRHDRYLAI